MNRIQEELKCLKDEKYKEFNKKLCPDTEKEMLGIRVPKLRALASKISKTEEYNWKDFIKNDNPKYFEEVQLQGFIIAYKKLELKEKLEYLKAFISRIDSWAITDTVIPTLKLKDNELEEYWNFILKYVYSDKEFEVRFSIVSMLDYFINDKYVDKVIEILNNISHEGYYVKMAAAWTLAEIGIKYNNKAMIFLNGNNNLDKFTYNKTLQKMIESYRIDIKQKESLKNMKRK